MKNVKRILNVTKSDDKYATCNVCAGKFHLQSNCNMSMLQFGFNNHSTTISICRECLNDFSDILWDYLSSEDEEDSYEEWDEEDEEDCDEE